MTVRYAVIGCKLKQNSNESCNSCASLAGLVLCFIACFILLVMAPLLGQLLCCCRRRRCRRCCCNWWCIIEYGKWCVLRSSIESEDKSTACLRCRLCHSFIQVMSYSPWEEPELVLGADYWRLIKWWECRVVGRMGSTFRVTTLGHRWSQVVTVWGDYSKHRLHADDRDACVLARDGTGSVSVIAACEKHRKQARREAQRGPGNHSGGALLQPHSVGTAA